MAIFFVLLWKHDIGAAQHIIFGKVFMKKCNIRKCILTWYLIKITHNSCYWQFIFYPFSVCYINQILRKKKSELLYVCSHTNNIIVQGKQWKNRYHPVEMISCSFVLENIKNELITKSFIVVDNNKCRFKDVIFTTMSSRRKIKHRQWASSYLSWILFPHFPRIQRKQFCVVYYSYDTGIYILMCTGCWC